MLLVGFAGLGAVGFGRARKPACAGAWQAQFVGWRRRHIARMRTWRSTRSPSATTGIGLEKPKLGSLL